MDKPKISVITPVYNAGKYLRHCVESILKQSFRDFELILVDDGSKDGSGTMCDNIASKDCRIHVIHQQNAGAGAARNAGLALAKGEYVLFVDSDDFIESNYFKLLSQRNDELVFIDVDQVTTKGKVIGKEYISNYKNYSKDDILRFQMTGKIPWGGVRKCVKRYLLTNNNIEFSSHKIGEEAIYSYLVLRDAQSIGFINTPVYHYLQHGDSLSNSDVEDPWGPVANAMKEKVMEQGDYQKYGDTVNAFIEASAVVSIYKMALQYSRSCFIGKANMRWDRLKEQIDWSMSVDRKHQSFSCRALGLLARARLWSLIWILCHMKR